MDIKLIKSSLLVFGTLGLLAAGCRIGDTGENNNDQEESPQRILGAEYRDAAARTNAAVENAASAAAAEAPPSLIRLKSAAASS